MVFSGSGSLVYGVLLTSVAGLLAAAGSTPSPAYRAEVEAWQKHRDDSLRADESWLTLAGLIWLKEGANTVGSAAGSDVLLPAGSAPAHVATLEFHHGKTHLKTDPGAGLTVNNKPAQDTELKSDESGDPDIVRLGHRIAFQVIKRGKRYAVRLKDNESKAHREFRGIERFPIQEDYRIAARWVPSPRKVEVPNILGETESHDSPGYAVFQIGGHEQRMVPYIEEPGDQKLFWVFKDKTSGKETYGAARFLYSAMPEKGQVILDFNKAYNPPCAFTPYATCPLPMKENVLPVKIEAGEKFHGH